MLSPLVKRGHSLEGELLHASGRRGDIDVALRIGADHVAPADRARRLDRPDDFERPSVDYRNRVGVSDIEKRLLRIRREGE
jgi:hypothetical protein